MPLASQLEDQALRADRAEASLRILRDRVEDALAMMFELSDTPIGKFVINDLRAALTASLRKSQEGV